MRVVGQFGGGTRILRVIHGRGRPCHFSNWPTNPKLLLFWARGVLSLALNQAHLAP